MNASTRIALAITEAITEAVESAVSDVDFSEAIDYSEIAYAIDHSSIADYISACDVAEQIDVGEVAQELAADGSFCAAVADELDERGSPLFSRVARLEAQNESLRALMKAFIDNEAADAK